MKAFSRLAQRRISEASQQYPAARREAARANLSLELVGNDYYRLSDDDEGWLLHLFPATQLIRSARHRRAKAPHLGAPANWNLMQIVQIAASLKPRKTNSPLILRAKTRRFAHQSHQKTALDH